MEFDGRRSRVMGPGGTLRVAPGDEVARRLVMLMEGQCAGVGPTAAARKFGISRQRYHQLHAAYLAGGSTALAARRRGPKAPHRRTHEVVRQIIRHRFLDADASVTVIAQKLNQTGLRISVRSVERVIAAFGLQKKTLRLPAES